MSKADPNEKVDVIVIGAGVAGAVSAAFLAKSGLKVAIVDKPGGASLQSSGAIDVANEAAITQRLHPYAKIGEEGVKMLPQALALLRELAHDVDFHKGVDGRNLLLASQLGTLKESAMVQRTQACDLAPLVDGDCIAVVGFAALPCFDARSIARMLAWSLQNQGKNVVVQPLNLEVSFYGEVWRSAMEMANAVDEPGFGEQLIEQIHKLLSREETKYKAVLIPPILGRLHYRRRWRALNEFSENKFFEMLAMPHSAPGLRLKDALSHGLKRLGVKFISGEAVEAKKNDAHIEAVYVDSDGKRSLIESRAFVLSTGRFLSGGFTREGTRRERIFDLPLWDEDHPIENAHVLTLSQQNVMKEQAIFKIGVSVDDKLRPQNRHMELFALNLFAAGSTIGGYDSSGILSGLGVAAITGLVSGIHTRDYLSI